MAVIAPFASWPLGGRPSGYFRRPLGTEAADFYQENGFLVIEDAFTPEQVDELNQEAVMICRGERSKEIAGLQPILPGETDQEVLQRHLCIHFPHKISDVILRQLGSDPLVEVLNLAIGPNVKCMQSMLFIKAAGKPGQAWHQDEDYIPTRDRSLTGAWLALDDATTENGCLWVIPGSHKPGVLWPMRWHGNMKKFDCSDESYDYPYTDDMAVPVEVKKGSLVVFNGYLLHRSLPNVAKSGFRRALVNHYMSAESLLPWFWSGNSPTEGQVATWDSRDVIMVSGQDPYGYKGTVDIYQTHVRPSGEGGCGPSKVGLVDDEEDH